VLDPWNADPGPAPLVSGVGSRRALSSGSGERHGDCGGGAHGERETVTTRAKACTSDNTRTPPPPNCVGNDPTDPAVAAKLVDWIAAEVGVLTCW
jgi:hypothetical protein